MCSKDGGFDSRADHCLLEPHFPKDLEPTVLDLAAVKEDVLELLDQRKTAEDLNELFANAAVHSGSGNIPPPVLRLLKVRDKVIKVSSVPRHDLEAYFRIAAIHLRSRPSTQWRDSSSTLSSLSSLSSSQASTCSSIFSQASDASSNTQLSNNSSASNDCSIEAVRGQKAYFDGPIEQETTEMQIQAQPRSNGRIKTRGLKSRKSYVCPHCRKVSDQTSKYKSHIRDCEHAQKWFHCYHCEYVDKREMRVIEHCKTAKHNGFGSFGIDTEGIRERVAFGCWFCGTGFIQIDPYINCMIRNQESFPSTPPSPSMHLKGLLEQTDIKMAMTTQCAKHERHEGLPYAFRDYEWVERTAGQFANRLQFGHLPQLLGQDMSSFLRAILDQGQYRPKLASEGLSPVIAARSSINATPFTKNKGEHHRMSKISNINSLHPLPPRSSTNTRSDVRISTPEASEEFQLHDRVAMAQQPSGLLGESPFNLGREPKRPLSYDASSHPDAPLTNKPLPMTPITRACAKPRLSKVPIRSIKQSATEHKVGTEAGPGRISPNTARPDSQVLPNTPKFFHDNLNQVKSNDVQRGFNSSASALSPSSTALQYISDTSTTRFALHKTFESKDGQVLISDTMLLRSPVHDINTTVGTPVSTLDTKADAFHLSSSQIVPPRDQLWPESLDSISRSSGGYVAPPSELLLANAQLSVLTLPQPGRKGKSQTLPDDVEGLPPHHENLTQPCNPSSSQTPGCGRVSSGLMVASPACPPWNKNLSDMDNFSIYLQEQQQIDVCDMQYAVEAKDEKSFEQYMRRKYHRYPEWVFQP